MAYPLATIPSYDHCLAAVHDGTTTVETSRNASHPSTGSYSLDVYEDCCWTSGGAWDDAPVT